MHVCLYICLVICNFIIYIGPFDYSLLLLECVSSKSVCWKLNHHCSHTKSEASLEFFCVEPSWMDEWPLSFMVFPTFLHGTMQKTCSEFWNPSRPMTQCFSEPSKLPHLWNSVAAELSRLRHHHNPDAEQWNPGGLGAVVTSITLSLQKDSHGQHHREVTFEGWLFPLRKSLSFHSSHCLSHLCLALLGDTYKWWLFIRVFNVTVSLISMRCI